MTEAISRSTEDGFVFRVDLDLRPEGRSGPIVNSLRAAELYYQTFGRSWERNAMLKARPGAGDEAVGEELLQALEPFIWRASLDLEVVGEIQAMKARIDARAGAEGAADLKLGKGGIREGEFFVSALQLLHGGKPGAKALRERGVLAALDRLLFAGVVPSRDRDALSDAYLYLRRCEHRVQMVEGAQTHRLPPPGERLPLARAMGHATVEEFEATLSAHRERVAALFAGLLGTAGEQAAPLDPELALLADQEVEPERRRELATRRGLQDPDRAIAAIDAMARRATPFSRMGDPAVAVGLLSDALETPDPDQALSHLSDFAAALRAPGPLLQAAGRAAPRRPPPALALRHLRLPLQALPAPPRADRRPAARRPGGAGEAGRGLRAGAGRAARPSPAATGSTTGWSGGWASCAATRTRRSSASPLHDIAGSVDLPSVARQLTDLAEALLVRCLALAEEEAEAKGYRPPGRLCVIGMGKLGGRELGYHSDLDLIFLYPGGAEPGFERYPRLAQRFMAFLQMPLREGRLYQIDTRLRPSGNQGALVIGADAFARYHVGEAVPLGGSGRGARPRSARSSGSARPSCAPASWAATRRCGGGSRPR